MNEYKIIGLYGFNEPEVIDFAENISAFKSSALIGVVLSDLINSV